MHLRPVFIAILLGLSPLAGCESAAPCGGPPASVAGRAATLLTRGTACDGNPIPAGSFVYEFTQVAGCAIVRYQPTLTTSQRTSVDHGRTPHIDTRTEIYDLDSGGLFEPGARPRFAEHVGGPWIRLWPADGTRTILCYAHTGLLAQALDLPGDTLVVAATSGRVAVLSSTGTVVVYGTQGANVTETARETLPLGPRDDISPVAAMTWVEPAGLLAINTNSNRTRIYSARLELLATIEGRLVSSGPSLAPSILPLRTSPNKIDFVQLGPAANEVCRATVPVDALYAYMPSPDGSQCVIVSRGRFKDNECRVLTVSPAQDGLRLYLSKTLTDWPVGWRTLDKP
ncbi:MAG: hypothetical protein GIKADHBN_00568 [Phycisphaerales bacterium]|nr:hypothetical protein [Phycisphaerales bacterium]